MAEQKTIIVTGLESEQFTYRSGSRAGQTGRMFKIEANDGRTYKTSNREFYDARRVGEEVTISFEAKSREWKGKTYTDYYISDDRRSGGQSAPQQSNADVLAALRQVYSRIDSLKEELFQKMEDNKRDLAALITMTHGEPEIPGPEDVEEAPDEEESDELESELKPGDIPF